MNKIYIEASVGEIIDKITILEIKRKKIGLYIKELRPYKVNFSIQKNINFSNTNKIANNLARPFKNLKVLKF